MAGFTKLFNSILMSSVWDESTDSRIVWVTLLALADQHGHVDGTVNSLARVARVPVPACQKALETFLGPDPMDRSGVDDGRRLRPEQGGWLIVNYAMYRDRMTADERRERDKLRKRAKRSMSALSPQASEFVRDVSHTEAEADQKQIRTEERTPLPPAIERRSPIQSRRRKDAAWEGPRVYVPQRCHRDFVALRNGAEAELLAWYEHISEEWTTGPRRAEEPGADMFAFWKARYAERWPATVQTPITAQRRPAWAVKS